MFFLFNHKLLNLGKLFLAIAFLIAVTLSIGYRITAFSGFPKGFDSFYHLAYGKMVSLNFPFVFWNSYWDMGAVFFYRNFPPLYHFTLGLLNRFFSLDLPKMITTIAALNICIMVISLFLTTFLLTKDIIISLFSGLFILASSTTWTYLIRDGIYGRMFSTMTICLGLLATVVWLKKKTKLTYYLLILTLVLMFLSHYFSGIIGGLAFLALVFSQEKSVREKIKEIKEIILPVIGLVSFYYLPVVLERQGKLGLVGKFSEGEKYSPMAFLSFFKQNYPGLPFFSLPLSLFISLLVFITDVKIKKNQKLIFKLFLTFGFLTLACLLYLLGFFRNVLYGISTLQMLLPTAIFLSLFLGLGLFFLLKAETIKKRLVAVLTAGLLVITFSQSRELKKLTINQSLYYPKLNLAVDENKLFRLTHNEDILAMAFNYYSQSLQTQGYFDPGIIHPDYSWWLKEAVFNSFFDNLNEVKFLLDWFAIKEIYIGGRYNQELQRIGQLQEKYSSPKDFRVLGSNEIEYLKAKPLIFATNSPVALFKKGEKEYLEFLKLLAKEGIDSRYLIPIKNKKANPKNFSSKTIEFLDKGKLLVKRNFSGQEPKFVNNQKKEVELTKYFSGVILKEFYFFNWQAYLLPKAGKKEKLKVYFAGPGMMYVSLPKAYNLPARVIFEYQVSWLEKTALMISLATLILLFVFGSVTPFARPGLANGVNKAQMIK